MIDETGLKSEVFKKYGLYSGEAFFCNSIISLGELKLTNDDIDFIRNNGDVTFEKKSGLNSYIEFVNDFFCNFKQYEENKNLFFHNGRNFFEEFKEFYKTKFGIKESYFKDWEGLIDLIDEEVGSFKNIYPIEKLTYYNPVLKEVFDYIDEYADEFPYQLYYDSNKHTLMLTCNITKAVNGLTDIEFDWQNYLKKYFNVPETEINYVYNHNYNADDYENNIFETDSDVIQFMFPLESLFQNQLLNKISIIFNGMEYTYFFKDKRKYKNPIKYYNYRFFKTFYLMTGESPYEWAKKEIASTKKLCLEYYGCMPEQINEEDDSDGLKIDFDTLEQALPELRILHRKIYMKNEIESENG